MKRVINIVESEIPEAALLPMPTEPIYSSAGLIKGNAGLSKNCSSTNGSNVEFLTNPFIQLVYPFISKSMNAALSPLP